MLATTFHVDGEVDLARFAPLRSDLTVARTGVDAIVVDLSEVTFMDTTGLAALFDGSAPGASVVVSAVSDPVSRLLDATREAGFVEITQADVGATRVVSMIEQAAPPAAVLEDAGRA